MTETGLREVTNPSAMFVSRQGDAVPGSVVLATQEGTRPLLVELQALVDESHAPNPRRVSYGPDRQCGSCQRKKNAEAKLAATVERKKLRIGDVVGKRNGVPEVVECQIIKNNIKRCEGCGDNESCLQYIRYVDTTAMWGRGV